MNKGEIIDSVAEKTGLTKRDCEKAVNAILSSIEEALTKREKVQLVGFGTFEVKSRIGRVGRNPKTGEPIEIPSTLVPTFKAGKTLKESVNA